MSEFSYQQYWALEEPVQRPHIMRSEELGIKFSGVPVSPALTRYGESLRRITELFSAFELEEDGIAVEQLLDKYSEMQVMDFLEEKALSIQFL